MPHGFIQSRSRRLKLRMPDSPDPPVGSLSSLRGPSTAVMKPAIELAFPTNQRRPTTWTSRFPPAWKPPGDGTASFRFTF